MSQRTNTSEVSSLPGGLSRRRMLGTTAAVGIGVAAPAIISRKALSSSGELNL